MSAIYHLFVFVCVYIYIYIYIIACFEAKIT